MNLPTRYILSGLCCIALTQNIEASNTNALVNELQPYTVSELNSPNTFEYFDATTYTQLSDNGRTIDKYDIKTGKKLETVFDLSSARETVLNSIEGYRFSPDKTKILVWTDK